MSAAPQVRSSQLKSDAPPIVLLVGNPNVGKTTLFNALTGQQARVGNYPGVTVERRSAALTFESTAVELVDVPGAYSLSARSAEEQVALEAALGMNGHPRPSLLVVVLDAGQLTRNLYLTLQLVEFGVPMVLALSMLDEVLDHPPDAESVGKLFGVPCVPINPRRRQGLTELQGAVESALATGTHPSSDVRYPDWLRAHVDRVAEALPGAYRRNVEHDRALSMWALLSLGDDDELVAPQELRDAVAEVRVDAQAQQHDLDLDIIRARYDFIEQRIDKCYPNNRSDTPSTDWTERVDRVLLHPVYGPTVFVVLMLAVFQSLFTWTDPAIGLIEDGVFWLQTALSDWLPPGILADLLTQGVIGGVGNVVVFLPQIMLLFLMVGLLEDSGYMARVAYLMDRVLKGVGLHGKAFVPMLSGLACAVPAIMATRTMERQRDRLLTMMVVPLMTCSARLPVYALLIGALFPPSRVFGFIPVQGLLMVAMYVFSTVVTLAAAWVLGRTVVRGRSVPLILELPRYRLPTVSAVLRMVVQRSREFLVEAGTVILGFTVLLWALLSFPQPPNGDVMSEPGVTIGATTTSAQNAAGSDAAEVPTRGDGAEAAPHAIEHSYGGRIGKALEPVMAPLGFDWKITVGIIGAFSAREVFVSTMGLVFGLEETDDEAQPLRDKMRAETRADGSPAYPPLMGLSLMVFFALACQCMSTLAVVKRETRSWRWPALLMVYMTGLAYVASLLVYQGGKLLGFG